jgi:S1-C subfamily serine protease
MSGPKRLWSGEWMAESAAVRARMAERRALGVEADDEPAGEPPAEQPPTREPASARAHRALVAALATVGAGWRALVARARGGAAARLVPRGHRARLVAIAVIAGVAGAAVMIGVEAASGDGTPTTAASSRAYLGVELANSLFEPGAEVVAVIPGSPADDAGVMVGDVIRSVNGHTIFNASSLVDALAGQRPGAPARLGLDRLGQPLTVTVTLGSQPSGGP